MAKLFYGHVPVDGVRINYYRTGGEKPPIILLHGFSDNALSWNQVPVFLEADFDVVLIDARGHGSSGLAEDGASPEARTGVGDGIGLGVDATGWQRCRSILPYGGSHGIVEGAGAGAA